MLCERYPFRDLLASHLVYGSSSQKLPLYQPWITANGPSGAKDDQRPIGTEWKCQATCLSPLSMVARFLESKTDFKTPTNKNT
jgi:hypothetical protein